MRLSDRPLVSSALLQIMPRLHRATLPLSSLQGPATSTSSTAIPCSVLATRGTACSWYTLLVSLRPRRPRAEYRRACTVQRRQYAVERARVILAIPLGVLGSFFCRSLDGLSTRRPTGPLSSLLAAAGHACISSLLACRRQSYVLPCHSFVPCEGVKESLHNQ